MNLHRLHWLSPFHRHRRRQHLCHVAKAWVCAKKKLRKLTIKVPTKKGKSMTLWNWQVLKTKESTQDKGKQSKEVRIWFLPRCKWSRQFFWALPISLQAQWLTKETCETHIVFADTIYPTVPEFHKYQLNFLHFARSAISSSTFSTATSILSANSQTYGSGESLISSSMAQQVPWLNNICRFK